MSPAALSAVKKAALTKKRKDAPEKPTTKRKQRAAAKKAAARAEAGKRAVARQLTGNENTGTTSVTKEKISRDWPVFSETLATSLSSMKQDQFLIISRKHSNRFIQFAAQGPFGFRAEVSSNAYLPPSDRLSEAEIKQLILEGWQPPTGSPGASTPEKDPDGSPNFFIDYPSSLESRTIAEQAVTALARILHVPHPGFLAYKAFDDDGNEVVFNDLGIKREVQHGGNDSQKIATCLLAVLRKITRIQDLDFDDDGDIAVRYGSVSIFIRIVGNPGYARFYAPLVRDVTETPQLHARLNELNAALGHMHFFVREGTIFAISDVPASPLQYDHIATALHHFSDIADGMDDLLEAEFGGQSIQSSHTKSVLIN